MEFLMGLAAGFMLWNWWWMATFVILVLADSVLIDQKQTAAGTIVMIIGLAALGWIAADTNPFAWVFNNLGNLLSFAFFYFIIGGLYSILKWKVVLRNIAQEMRKDLERNPGVEYRRPRDSRPNSGRIIGWICHWPMSIIGMLIGDVLFRLAEYIYDMLSSLYARMADSEFDKIEAEYKAKQNETPSLKDANEREDDKAFLKRTLG